MNNFSRILLCGIIFDILLFSLIAMMPHFYFNTIIASCIINIVSIVCNEIRVKKLGFVIRKEKYLDNVYFLMTFSGLLPILNVIFSNVFFYKLLLVDDEKYIDYNRCRFMPLKKVVKEYEEEEKKELISNSKNISDANEISREEHNTAVKFMEIENYIDEIRMNVNLSNKQKEQLLKQMRNQILTSGDVKISNNKIKKLSKIPK